MEDTISAMQQLVDNRYRIVELLGSGEIAEVYLTRDEVLDQDVALKVLLPRYAKDAEFAERFGREAKSAGVLFHSNIVSIYERGEIKDGTYYIVMGVRTGGYAQRAHPKGGSSSFAYVARAVGRTDGTLSAHEGAASPIHRAAQKGISKPRAT